MARISVLDGRIRELVARKLIPLFLIERTTAALCKSLNEALPTGEGAVIHPNRIHALLSEGVARGVHESTVELVERAANRLIEGIGNWLERSEDRLLELRAEVRRLRADGRRTDAEIVKRLGLPPAVGRHVLGSDAQGMSVGAPHSAVLGVDELGDPSEPSGPDWSYQDVAVARCVEALARRSNARVGLVLPTGAGKTRVALRIILALLAQAVDANTPVLWVTHRRNLREQAHRELQKLIGKGEEQILADRLVTLANRIKFVMVGDLPQRSEVAETRPALIVIDEAHHAAAPSYQSVFADFASVPVLLLTATPNRTDRLPIGIDEVAFTITYRELAERRAVLIPKFLDFPVPNFDWSAEDVADLAESIIDYASAEFTKVLVLAPRVDRVEEFYKALLDQLPPDHPLEPQDLGYIHGAGNSLNIDNEDCLARFRDKPRAILVSAQLLLEGFDDPAINAVVMTYPSTSVIRLMQAAGRCVRYAPGKRAAYVLQARNDELAYHFDQRWLYQEIDDFLKPQLLDLEYGSKVELAERVRQLLHAHNVRAEVVTTVLDRLDSLSPGEPCRLFFYGLPYYGAAEAFEDEATWGVVLEASDNSAAVRDLFNRFCALGADLSDPSRFLQSHGAAHGIDKDDSIGSQWTALTGLLTASYFAKREVHGPTPLDSPGSRPYRFAGATTWLKYCSFTFRPAIPAALTAFLRDCHNAARIEALYCERGGAYVAAVKVPLPLVGSEAALLEQAAYQELQVATATLRSDLSAAPPQDQFGVLAAFQASSLHTALPARLLRRLEFLLTTADHASRLLVLNAHSTNH